MKTNKQDQIFQALNPVKYCPNCSSNIFDFIGNALVIFKQKCANCGWENKNHIFKNPEENKK